MKRVPILHEDPHLLVVDKPAGMLVVPAPDRSGPTVVDAVRRDVEGDIHAVHRLDEATTGVLVLARTAEAKSGLEALFRDHAIERIYLAVLAHVPDPAAGRIESRLREHGDIVKSVASGPGRRAVTHYRTLRRLDRQALVECRLETGRRNQIRVHMADLECPVVGDRKYGYRARGGITSKHPLLHAWKIAFEHPSTKHPVEVTAPVPETFPRP